MSVLPSPLDSILTHRAIYDALARQICAHETAAWSFYSGVCDKESPGFLRSAELCINQLLLLGRVSIGAAAT